MSLELFLLILPDVQLLTETGLCESGYYPGIQHSLGSWYRRDELGKRACIFQVCSAMGQMASGYIMGGVYHLSGVGGYKGWQWFVWSQCYHLAPISLTDHKADILWCRAFIINGSISLPMALAGYFILPDVPEITKSWYLSDEVSSLSKPEWPLLIQLQDIKLSQLRMQLEGRKPRSKYTKTKLKRIFNSWHIYLLALLYVWVNALEETCNEWYSRLCTNCELRAFNNGIANTQPIFQQYVLWYS